MDHLTEDPGYYEKLRRMEKGAFKLQGHISMQGLPIAIENRKGSARQGVGDDGKPWRTVMKHPYGYIKGTKGKDGEEVDAYVGPDKTAPHAFVVHQHNEDGRGHDEDKVMLGFRSKAEARGAFLAHYDDPKYLGPISTVPMERLKALVEAGKPLQKIAEARGFWRGKTVPIDSVKKTVRFQGFTVRLDRPKGFEMTGADSEGKPWHRVYKYDYGFLPKTEGGDGEGLDVFLGPDENAHDAFWVIQRKKDGSFDEYKVFLGFKDKASARAAYAAHIPMQFFGGMAAMRVGMMRAMLGQDPLEKMAATLAFGDELGKILESLRG